MSSHKIRLFSDVGAKMSMFNKRAKEHRESQMINPFSEWGGPGSRRKLSREDPEYGRPVEGSKTAERGRLAQIQMIGDMVELCDMIYDCGIRSPDGRAAISFGDAFRLYSAINDKVVGLLMRGRKHKILDFEGEMLFQGRDDRTMIELLMPLNTIRHKYGMPERAGCGEVDHELLQQLAEQERLLKQKQQRKQQRTRSAGVPPLPAAPGRHQKSRSIDNSWPSAEQARAMLGAIGPSQDEEAPGASADGTGQRRPGPTAESQTIRELSQDKAAVVTSEDRGQRMQPTCLGASEERQEVAATARETEGRQEANGSHESDETAAEMACNTGGEDKRGEVSPSVRATDEQQRETSSAAGGAEGEPRVAQPVGEVSDGQPPSSKSAEQQEQETSAAGAGGGQQASAPPADDVPTAAETERPQPDEPGRGRWQPAVSGANDLDMSAGQTLAASATAAQPHHMSDQLPPPPEPALESQLKPEPKLEAEPKPKPELEPDSKPEQNLKAELKPEPGPTSKSEILPGSEPDVESTPTAAAVDNIPPVV